MRGETRKEGSEKVGSVWTVLQPCAISYSANSTYRAFRFSSEIQRPAGRPALGGSALERSRSFDHTFRKSLKPFSTFSCTEQIVSLHFPDRAIGHDYAEIYV